MIKKYAPYIVGLLAILGIVAAVANWFQPARKTNDEAGVVVSAAHLFKTFNEDEEEANRRYLGKTVEVTGTVADTGTNLDGQKVVILNTDSPAGDVVCTFQEIPTTIYPNQPITIKGYCAGILADVMLTDCIAITDR